MFKIFLAAENARARKEIRELMKWDPEQFVLVGEAADGESALSKIRDLEPDILVTGVRMPFMDGVALCQAVRYSFPWIEILLLNGHDDALDDALIQALRVSEVLFRPVSEHSLRSAVLSIVRGMEEHARVRPWLLKQANQEISWRRHEYERLLSDWLQGKAELPEGYPKWKLLRRMLLLPVPDRSCGRQLSGLLRVIERRRAGDRLCTFELPEGVGMIASATDAMELERTVYGIATAVRRMAPQADVDAPQVLIGGCFPTVEMLREDYQALRGQTADTARPILGPGDAMRAVPGQPGDVVELAELLMSARLDEVDGILAEYGGLPDAEEVARAAAEIEREVCGTNRERWTPQQEPAARRGQLFRALTLRDIHRPQCRALPITRMRRQIARDYRNPGMSLGEAARLAGMAEERFSIVFRQEMGRTFLDHLTRLRVNAAVKLLASTRMRISQISRSVGYNDTDYFAVIFARIMGATPKEYRQRHAGK